MAGSGPVFGTADPDDEFDVFQAACALADGTDELEE